MTNARRVKLSPNGLEVSSIIQGYWRMSDWQRSVKAHAHFLSQHVDLGVTTVDQAHVYGNPSCESLLGEVFALDTSLRSQLEIVTKCGIQLVDTDKKPHSVNHYDSSARAIVESVNTSLSRMKTDYIDLLLIHRPDFLLDADEVAQAFDSLIVSGKVRHFGVSNFTTHQFELLNARFMGRLVTNQVEINPLNMQCIEDGTLDQMQQLRLRPMAWSCLAGGAIMDRQQDGMNAFHTVLSRIAEEIGATSIDQVLYAWVMHLPSKPIPIVGSGNIERVSLAVEAQDLRLSRDQWYQIWVSAKGHGVP